MNKPDKERLIAYIKGTLTQAEIDEMDKLLLTDEDALASYLMSLEEIDLNEATGSPHQGGPFTFPNVPDQAKFADRIMARIDTSQQNKNRKRAEGIQWSRLLSHKMVHYTVAASITVLFISTGVFDRLAAANLNKEQTDATQPYSEIMVEKATGWLDLLKPKP